MAEMEQKQKEQCKTDFVISIEVTALRICLKVLVEHELV